MKKAAEVAGGFVSINGDSMAGLLKALYGFTAGDNGIKILDVYQTSESNPQERKKYSFY